MRIGIFGGTFNPVHQGHLIAAEEVRERFHLDRVLFVPSARPPHKPRPGLLAAEHRLAMTRLAVEGNPAFAVSTVEVERRGPSYSVETVEALARTWGRDARFFFVLGIDAFCEIDTWHRPERLLALCDFIVISRPGRNLSEAREVLARRFSVPWPASSETAALPGGRRLHLARVPAVEISSTEIRRRLADGRSVKYLLPEAVESYILSHHLYGETRDRNRGGGPGAR